MLERASNCYNPPLHISGYCIVEKLYIGSRAVVYRAVEASSQRSVIIKLLRYEHPSFTDLLQFRNQYTIAKNLTIPGIVYPYSLESYRNSYAIVMEDFGGISLRHYAQAQPIPVADVLAIALQLTEILHDLYQASVIHKDIQPANILIQQESKQIKLIDFSIASLLPKETQEIKNPKRLEGTLAYLAPEQTGRMNRGIDYRVDFYALGVTLFELLTGQLPFQSPDPMQLVHCHLAKQPPRVHSLYPEIPIALSNIVSKLMAKNAEDRYQSALGLKHDLEQCLSQWQQTGSIAEFALGTQDISDRFLIPEKLYGREKEVTELLNVFNRVSQGSSELILVTGFSGIGKTAVVNEVHKPIACQRGYFIKGKFDQFSRNIPFTAFLQAFRSLMSQLLGESDTALAAWKTRILDAVGTSGRVITEVIPELELIIGAQPSVPELSGISAQNRFNVNTTLDFFTILKASQAISSTIDIEELLGHLTQVLLQNSGSDRCAIILCESDGRMQVRAIATLDFTDLCAIPLEEAQKLPIQLIQYVRSSKEKIFTHHADDALPLVDRDLHARCPASILCLPLLGRTQLRGILYLENQTTAGVFHPERLVTLNLLATQATISLENARLYQQAQDYAKRLEDSQVKLLQSEKMATHDPLTGLPNRRLLMDRLEGAIARCHRSGQTFGLIFFDLDGFKRVNDTYGHQVGDELLVQVTQRLKACMRRSDEFFRLGGDEFVILVEEIKSINSIIKFAEKLLSSLQSSFGIKNYEVTVGGSFGVKVYDALHPQTVSHILADADNAMYEAKKRKNCIILHENK